MAILTTGLDSNTMASGTTSTGGTPSSAATPSSAPATTLPIAAARKASSGQATLADKMAALKRVKDLEAKRVRKRRELFEAEDEIDRQRGEMIAGVEARLQQTSRRQPAFAVRWLVV